MQSYDFAFELFFDCTHPSYIPDTQPCVLRCGAIHDYAREYADKLALGLRLVNTPEEHEVASELALWYPSIEDLTPRSLCADTFPSAAEVQSLFGWPVFIKGSRQTSKHDPTLCIARDAGQYRDIVQRYKQDPILHWQKIAIREFVELQPVAGEIPGKVRPSLEVRTFWWQGECVGWGQYWSQLNPYDLPHIESGLAIAREAAQRLRVPFLVIDIALTTTGRWIVIECNDAQESGYTAIAPQQLWCNILDRLTPLT